MRLRSAVNQFINPQLYLPMLKFSTILFVVMTFIGSYTYFGNTTQHVIQNKTADTSVIGAAKFMAQVKWPEGLTVTPFSGPNLTPSPACIATAPTGEVFVGVDMIGSLGKDPGKGRIIRLVDTDNDGKMHKHTDFADIDDPRGILVMGDKVFVLHTVFTNGKASGMNLEVFEDKNNDGVADGPAKPLIEHISNAHMLAERGTDHATNGIRMGIDGWIYIAVGDFGLHDAIDRSGKKMPI